MEEVDWGDSGLGDAHTNLTPGCTHVGALMWACRVGLGARAATEIPSMSVRPALLQCQQVDKRLRLVPRGLQVLCPGPFTTRRCLIHSNSGFTDTAIEWGRPKCAINVQVR